jgi:hypothetical protein
MPKSYRIKAEPNQDKNIFVNLEQDFDQLEILSLKIIKSEVYSRTCADYGVIVGRAQANGGFGIPNAKISIFVPITDEDAEDEVISQLYPYRKVTDKNEDGYRYNLLPKESESCNHKATGNFFTAKEVINNPVILEVFEKYYKYTTKTNESGDYMLWGVPLGNQTIHASIDVSDIGCYSMRPYQFIRQGVSASRFESALEFKSSENLDTLPQIVLQNKAIQVVPFWGDEDLCGIGITRVDFDLRDSGVEITPSSTFIGSIITDDDNNYVSISGVPSKEQGQLCNLTTGTGTIEAIRHTILKEEDGSTPKLERFNLDNGGKVIDGNGAWVTQLPMNLDFIVTNEYGQQIISDDPKVGIPTRAKYRFRISFDGTGGEVRSGRYLVPNIREYTDEENYPKSYSFSDKLVDYPEVSTPQDVYGSPANKATDYFYEFVPNRVYSVANFIDNYRQNVNQGGNRSANSRWRFLGIKTINPAPESRCTDITKEFPVNDVFRGGTSKFSTTQITRLLQVITLTIAACLISYQLFSLLFQYGQFALRTVLSVSLFTAGTTVVGTIIDTPIGTILLGLFTFEFFLSIATAIFGPILIIPIAKALIENFYVVRQLYNYPNCEPCFCGTSFKFFVSRFISVPEEDKILQETIADDPNSINNCNEEPYMEGFGSEEENAFFYQGREDEYPKGCYVLQFRRGVFISFIATLALIIPAGFIPFAGGAIVYGALAVGLSILFGTCLDSVYRMYKSLNQWRILANIYTGLCEGVFNMKFSNNWINGTLYFPKFIVKKQKINDENGQEITPPIVKYDTRLIYEDTNENNTYYYYRSCPFSEQGFTYSNPSVDLSSLTTPLKAPHKGINFPTTIVDLGPLDPCITELCKEQNSDDTCVIIDNLKSSSFQPSEELLGMLIERKIIAINSYREFVWSGVNKWFGADSKPGASYNRNFGNDRLGSAGDNTNPGPWRNRVIDGDIAQLLATNNQMGISVFTKDDEDPYYGDGTVWGDEYSNIIGQENYLTESFTQIPLIPRNNDLINCLKGGIFGIKQTQVVPYYGWNSSASYGTLNNDYDFDGQILVKGYQQGITYTTPNRTDTATWETPAYYDSNEELPNYGYFNSIPTIVPTSTGSNFILGTGLYFYFGLRQGASSYDRFINEYLPPKDDGQEL